MADLDTLRTEVREALASIQGDADCRCSEPYKSRGMKDPQCNHDLQDSVDVVRAELLRLADECAMIPRAQLLANFAAANERAEKAEAKLATAQNTIKAQQDMMGALKRKLALSEGELAAIKAKIGASQTAYLTSRTGIGPCNIASMAHGAVFDANSYGKTVRLVVEE